MDLAGGGVVHCCGAAHGVCVGAAGTGGAEGALAGGVVLDHCSRGADGDGGGIGPAEELGGGSVFMGRTRERNTAYHSVVIGAKCTIAVIGKDRVDQRAWECGPRCTIPDLAVFATARFCYDPGPTNLEDLAIG